MEHPLIGNLDDLSIDDLTTKISDLQKKLGIAQRTGNFDLCNQIRMALENYQNKYREKSDNLLKSRTTNSGTNFDDIIDIS